MIYNCSRFFLTNVNEFELETLIKTNRDSGFFGIFFIAGKTIYNQLNF